MLTEIRDRSSGWFAWIIAAIIIIPMAFFGIQQYATSEANPTIVELGDQSITQREFQSNLAAEQNRVRQANPGLADAGILDSDFYKQQVLQRMINRSLTSYLANEFNYQVSDQQINDLIRQDPTFQVDGKFDSNVYQAIAASRGPTGVKTLRAEIESNARAQQVISGYQESGLVLASEVRELLEMQAEQRSFDLVTVKQADYRDQVTVSEQDIADYYDQNIDNFMLPDRTSVSYIELDKQKIAESVEVTDETVTQLYDDYLESFIADETRETRHILVAVNEEQDDATAKAKADDIAAQLAGGADFAELATAESDDPGSAANGGSLGDVERGQMVAEFEAATFALEPGVVSQPVKSQFGYHIIRVDSINATEAEPIEALRFQLVQEEKDRVAEELVIEQAEQLRNLLFEQSDSLDAAAQALELPIQQSELFSLDAGEGIATHAVVREAAFSETVQNEELNSDLLEIADGVFVALRKLAYEAEAPKPLADASDEIKTLLTNERAIAAAKAAGEQLIERARTDWTSLTADEALTIQSYTISLIEPNPAVNQEVSRQVISMQLEDEQPTVVDFTSANGDYNVIRLTKIEEGDLSKVSEQIRNATRNLVQQRNGGSLYSAYVNGLQQELNLQINEDLL